MKKFKERSKVGVVSGPAGPHPKPDKYLRRTRLVARLIFRHVVFIDTEPAHSARAPFPCLFITKKMYKKVLRNNNIKKGLVGPTREQVGLANNTPQCASVLSVDFDYRPRNLTSSFSFAYVAEGR